jgi:prepilin-type N-terminal cleavage/methylation domain-containing protein
MEVCARTATCTTPSRVRRARRRSRGFSLIELMVVVILVAVLAVLAAPAMRVAKDDRMTFDYARQVSQILHRARARAAARGGAHLVAIDKGTLRGRFLLFEALDGDPPADGGPRPVSSCKGQNQWAEVSTFAPGTVGNRARIVEGLDLDTLGVNVDANIFAEMSIGGTAASFIAFCVTPSGATYASAGSDINDAITKMQTSLPFASVLDVTIQRHDSGGGPLGLARHVLVASGGAPRIRSY